MPESDAQPKIWLSAGFEMNFCQRIAALFAVSVVGTAFFPAVHAQSILVISAVADDLADVANFVSKRSIFEGVRVISVSADEPLIIGQRILSAQTLKLESNARIIVEPFGKGVGADGFYIVARRLILPTGGEPALVTWAGQEPPRAPGDGGRAESGADGRGTGQSGFAGQTGRAGSSGANGADAPMLTIVVMEVVGSDLVIDLSGGAGGTGGRGQHGGHGGDGARGNSARNAMVSIFGAKTAVGCAAGPGRGGDGGDGGNGGRGGTGGNGGAGGVTRVVAPSQVADAFFDRTTIKVSGGAPGAGGAGGQGGDPGAGGPEGARTSLCAPAGRNGASGRPGSAGPPGANGRVGQDGSLERVDLSERQLADAFNF